MGEHLPIIVVELVLVLGGTIAFGWWQLRDVRRAQAQRRAREAAERAATQDAASPTAEPRSGPDAPPPDRRPPDPG